MAKLTKRVQFLKIVCYLTVLYNMAVFSASAVIYVKDRSSWQANSNTGWVRWQWLDLTVSALSILVALLLLGALLTKNQRLLQVVLVWIVLCIIISLLLLGFGFSELGRGDILARSMGIAVSSYTLEPMIIGNPSQSHTVDGGVNIEVETPRVEYKKNNIRNVIVWYEDSKL